MITYIYDTNFVRVGIMDAYESFIWTDRYNKCGDFEFYLPAGDSRYLELLHLNYYVQLYDTVKKVYSDHMMIIEKIEIKHDAEEGDHLIVSGRSLESILDRRIVWGKRIYTSKNPDYICKQLITEAIISPTDSRRQISNFIYTDSTDTDITGVTIDEKSYKADSLYDAITDICRVQGFGFKIVLNSSNQFVFSLYNGKDRTPYQSTNARVIFKPEYGNLISADYYMDLENYSNVAFGDGPEVTDNGTTTWYTSSYGADVSGLARREFTVDASGVSTSTDGGTARSSSAICSDIDEECKEELEERVPLEDMDGEMDPNLQYKLGTDYKVGDIVWVDYYGLSAGARITEIIYADDREGFKVYPTFEFMEEEEEEDDD